MRKLKKRIFRRELRELANATNTHAEWASEFLLNCSWSHIWSHDVIRSHGTQGSRTKRAPSPVRILNEWFPVLGVWVHLLSQSSIKSTCLCHKNLALLVQAGWWPAIREAVHFRGNTQGPICAWVKSWSMKVWSICCQFLKIHMLDPNMLPDVRAHSKRRQQSDYCFAFLSARKRRHLWARAPMVLCTAHSATSRCSGLHLFGLVWNDRKWIHFAHCTSLPHPP